MHFFASVETDEVLPARVDVVVIGGGIIGVTTALYLARRGVSVAVCEKGEFGAEQSSRNWGWVRKMGRDPRELPLAVDGLREWGRMNEMVGGETGFRVRGITYFAADEAIMAKYLTWTDYAKPFGLDTRPLTGDEVAGFFPGATQRFVGGLHTPSDGMAEPSVATAAIAVGARRHGARLYRYCAVRGIETAAGRVSGVVTERGPIACGQVVLAGGAWSSLFAGNTGLRLPQLKFLANFMRTLPVDGGPDAAGSGPGFGFRKRLDGGYVVSMRSAHPVDIVPDSFRFFADFQQALRHERKAMRLRVGRRSVKEFLMARRWKLDEKSPFEHERILDPEPAHHILDAAKVNIGKLFPALANIVVAEKIGGLVDATPDALPVISAVESIPGFHISSGYSGHGFGVAPGAGRMMAQIVMGETPDVNPAPFRFSRYTDGSKIEHWPIGF
jgi:glycine/D-amino acid oxidase-like deaminating enzyme